MYLRFHSMVHRHRAYFAFTVADAGAAETAKWLCMPYKTRYHYRWCWHLLETGFEIHSGPVQQVVGLRQPNREDYHSEEGNVTLPPPIHYHNVAPLHSSNITWVWFRGIHRETEPIGVMETIQTYFLLVVMNIKGKGICRWPKNILTGNSLLLRYEPNRLMLSIGLWRWNINITIISEHYPSSCLLFKTQLNSTLWVCPYFTGNILRLRYEPNRLMVSIDLWR
jgi:hypothetical protein